MSYRCNACLYIFPNKHSNCPYCGGRIFQNEVSDSELINDGFMQAPTPPSYNEKTTSFTDNATNNQAHKNGNIFEELQASYNSEHAADQASSRPTTNNASHIEVPRTTPTQADTGSVSTEGGYFAQFNSGSNSYVPEVEIPPTVSPAPANSQSTYHNEAYEREMRQLEEQQRRIQRDYNRLAIMNFISNIRWRNVFRFLFILGIVVLLIVIWNMRYIIIESITNFLISLIPIIIIIAILWYLIKSLFK